MIKLSYRGSPLGIVPTPSRFSDPDLQYAVLYATAAVRCTFWEVLGRNRFTRRRRRQLPRSDVDARMLVSLCSTEPLRLVDLREDGPIRIGAPTAVVHDANHAAGRAFSTAIFHSVREAEGVLYQSRFTGDVCVAIFDKATHKLEFRGDMSLVRSAAFLQALSDYEITLMAA